MAKIFSGDNPSQLYFDSLVSLIAEGEIVAPRGKAVKEIKPVIFEFTNPLNRVTFLKGRKINPFFQLAEALWILRGRADVRWLTAFNKNMAEFSDDGEWFNAPYGERLRFWNQNSASGFIFNPIDQLADVLAKFEEDIHTRQAYASIYNPIFDNAAIKTKDRPCNLGIAFKVRNNKLDATVYNRSNDLHWGVFGANIVQFATIQETVAAWLGLEVGKYCQITDSLHVYLEDYGAKETEKIIKTYGGEILPEGIRWKNAIVPQFTFENEPRITLKFDEFQEFMDAYFTNLDPSMHSDETFENIDLFDAFLGVLLDCPDAYFKNTLLAMLAYRAHRLGKKNLVVVALSEMADSQWKLSCLYFLYNSYKDVEGFTKLYDHYSEDKKAYIQGL